MKQISHIRFYITYQCLESFAVLECFANKLLRDLHVQISPAKFLIFDRL